MMRSTSPRKGKRRPEVPSPREEALTITRTLKGHLRKLQLSCLQAVRLLASVRDRKLYGALQHPDLVSYARARLGLQEESLRRYLQTHDWVAAEHPGWLDSRPKGLIPDLADASALRWIEKRLKREHLDPAKREELEEMRQRALRGWLTRGEFQEFRRRERAPDWPLRAFVRRLRRAYQVGVRIGDLPPEALPALEAALESLRRRKSRHLPILNWGQSPVCKQTGDCP